MSYVAYTLVYIVFELSLGMLIGQTLRARRLDVTSLSSVLAEGLPRFISSET
jgi:hypothetical protein